MRFNGKFAAIAWAAILISCTSFLSAQVRVADAAENRDRSAIRSLLQKHADVNAPQSDGTTALQWAAHWDDLEVADLLISAGANVNAANEYGVTALSLACTNGSSSMIEKLLSAGANPNGSMKTGETPLMTCSRTGDVGSVKLLLARGADPGARELKAGQTALMWAAAEKHPDVVRELVDRRADVNAKSFSGFTPLMFASRSADLDSTKILLQAGAKVNERTPDGLSALLVASSSGTAEAVAELLLANGADPNVADLNGITPLHYAVQKGISVIGAAATLMPNQPGLVKALLEHGENPNAQISVDFPVNTRPDFVARTTLVGATPFFLAAACADVDSMRLLASNGANPRLATHEGMTPLMAAAGMGAESEPASAPGAIKLVLDLGADVNASNKDGDNALHLAASAGADAIIQLLAEAGANLNAKDKAGQTPLSIAQGGEKKSGPHVHQSTAAMLLKLGAKPTEESSPSTSEKPQK